MKNLTIMLVLITSIYTSKAQDALKLDEKYGFNKFSFTQTLEDVRKIAKLRFLEADEENKSITYYEVKNIHDYKLFEYSLTKIELSFYNNQLYGIVLTPAYTYTHEQNQLIHQDIFRRIQEQYGGFSEKEVSAMEKLNGITGKYEVQGNKVLLRFSGGLGIYSFFDVNNRNKIIATRSNGL